MLYDATLLLREGMVTFPGDPRFQIRPFFRREMGDPFNLALLSMGTHMGTHVDAPAHYLDGGNTVDQIPLDLLVGPACVLDMRGHPCIDRKALESSRLVGEATRILLKTDNGPRLRESAFREDYVHLTEDGSRYLVERGVRLVGIDYLSVDAYDSPGAPVHKTLLGAGIVLVEGVDLVDVPEGPCEVICLPLRVQGGDGAPARVIVRSG